MKWRVTYQTYPAHNCTFSLNDRTQPSRGLVETWTRANDREAQHPINTAHRVCRR